MGLTHPVGRGRQGHSESLFTCQDLEVSPLQLSVSIKLVCPGRAGETGEGKRVLVGRRTLL